MKKFFSFALIASALVAGFASCSNDDEVPGAQQGVAKPRGAIDFSITNNKGIATRGAEAGVTDIESAGFSVWAFDGTTAYMGSATAGVSVTGNNTAGWTYSPVQYWPTNGNKLKFMAVSPADYVTTYAAASDKVTASLTIPACAAQKDLMFAQNDGSGDGINLFDKDETTAAGQVALTFNHALSEIVFKGYLDNNDAIKKATVAEISIVNVKSEGDVVFTQAGAFSTDNLDTPAEYTSGLANTEITTKDAASANELTASDGALILLPQAITGWAAGSDARHPNNVDASGVPNDNGTYLRVRAQIINNQDVEIVNSSAIHYIPVSDITWAPGKKYTYTIKFTASSLTPIVFGTVSTTDWDPQVGGAVEF